MVVKYKQLSIEDVYVGNKQIPWDTAENKDLYMMKVRNELTGREIEFEYWPHVNSIQVGAEFNINTFIEFICTALSSELDYEEFCEECEYKYDSEYTKKRYKSNTDRLEKLKYIYEGNLDELAYEMEIALITGVY